MVTKNDYLLKSGYFAMKKHKYIFIFNKLQLNPIHIFILNIIMGSTKAITLSKFKVYHKIIANYRSVNIQGRINVLVLKKNFKRG